MHIEEPPNPWGVGEAKEASRSPNLSQGLTREDLLTRSKWDRERESMAWAEEVHGSRPGSKHHVYEELRKASEP